MIKVTAAVMVNDGMLLIAKRKPTGRLPNLWELPGGKVEPGETPEQTARRELKEETGAIPMNLARVGYVLVHNDDKPIEGYPFPDSFLVVFAATCGPNGVGENLEHESDGVLICSPDEAGEHLKFNEQLYLAMLEAARNRIGV